MSNTNPDLRVGNYGINYLRELHRLGPAVDLAMSEAALALQGWEKLRELQRRLAAGVCVPLVPETLLSGARLTTLVEQGDPVGFARSRDSMSGRSYLIAYGPLAFPEDNGVADAPREHTFSVLHSYVRYMHYDSEGAETPVDLGGDQARVIAKMAALLLGEL